MDAHLADRLRNLRSPSVPVEFLSEYLGVPWPPNEEFRADYDTVAIDAPTQAVPRRAGGPLGGRIVFAKP